MEPGETIEVPERIIVSPARPPRRWPMVTADVVDEGDIIGHVSVAGQEPVPVRSPFRGQLVEIVAWHGERVLHRQRIAWLRVAA